jgi:hypothetical protein
MDLRKVYGGTPVGNESRCDTCTYARIVKGYSEKERIVHCDLMYPAIRIPFRVAECSDYTDRRLPELDAMEKIALSVEIKSRPAGFVRSETVLQTQGDG